jgi:hypothetical protein
MEQESTAPRTIRPTAFGKPRWLKRIFARLRESWDLYSKSRARGAAQRFTQASDHLAFFDAIPVARRRWIEAVAHATNPVFELPTRLLEMAPQRTEKIESAPGNGVASARCGPTRC